VFEKIWKMDELLAQLNRMGRRHGTQSRHLPHYGAKQLARSKRYTSHDIKITPYPEGAFEGNFIHGRRMEVNGRVITRRTFIKLRKAGWKRRYSARGQALAMRAGAGAANAVPNEQ
jgi:hypothetical protein